MACACHPQPGALRQSIFGGPSTAARAALFASPLLAKGSMQGPGPKLAQPQKRVVIPQLADGLQLKSLGGILGGAAGLQGLAADRQSGVKGSKGGERGDPNAVGAKSLQALAGVVDTGAGESSYETFRDTAVRTWGSGLSSEESPLDVALGRVAESAGLRSRSALESRLSELRQGKSERRPISLSFSSCSDSQERVIERLNAVINNTTLLNRMSYAVSVTGMGTYPLALMALTGPTFGYEVECSGGCDGFGFYQSENPGVITLNQPFFEGFVGMGGSMLRASIILHELVHLLNSEWRRLVEPGAEPLSAFDEEYWAALFQLGFLGFSDCWVETFSQLYAESTTSSTNWLTLLWQSLIDLEMNCYGVGRAIATIRAAAVVAQAVAMALNGVVALLGGVSSVAVLIICLFAAGLSWDCV